MLLLMLLLLLLLDEHVHRGSHKTGSCLLRGFSETQVVQRLDIGVRESVSRKGRVARRSGSLRGPDTREGGRPVAPRSPTSREQGWSKWARRPEEVCPLGHRTSSETRQRTCAPSWRSRSSRSTGVNTRNTRGAKRAGRRRGPRSLRHKRLLKACLIQRTNG